MWECCLLALSISPLLVSILPEHKNFPALLEKQQLLQDASVKRKELPPDLRGLS